MAAPGAATTGASCASQNDERRIRTSIAEGAVPRAVTMASAPMLNAATEAVLDLPEGVPRPGETLDARYRIERVLGLGGMGLVLSAVQVGLNRRVAIKMLLPYASTDAERIAR